MFTSISFHYARLYSKILHFTLKNINYKIILYYHKIIYTIITKRDFTLKQLAFFIDVNKCIACRSCTFACSNENGISGVKRRKITTVHPGHSQEHIHFSSSCHHCETPACMTVCPNNCIQKLRNGIVLLNSQNCDGCGKCESVCPFQAITIDSKTNKADKCDMCHSRLQKGQQPACVESCIADAIAIKDIYEDYPQEYTPSFEGYRMKSITSPTTRYKYEKTNSTRFWAD